MRTLPDLLTAMRRNRVTGRWTACVVIAGAIVAGGASDAAAQRAVGILLEVDGSVDPPASSGAEIQGGRTIRLNAHARVSFVHYRTCRMVVVRGGTVTLREDEYDAAGGTVLSEKPISCPRGRRAGLARRGESSGTAGLTMRNVAFQRIPPRPDAILIADDDPAISQVRILRGRDIVATLKVEGVRASWPRDAKQLERGTSYLFQFIHTDGTTREVATVVDTEPDSDAAQPVVFAVD